MAAAPIPDWRVFQQDPPADADARRAYNRLFVQHVAAGLPYGPGPAGIAAWAAAQAAPVLGAEAAAALGARVRAWGLAEQAAHPPPA